MFAVYFFRGILTKVALFIALPIFYGGVGIFLGELIFGYGSYFGCSAVNDFG